jgi:hypothetical protein
MGNPALCRNTTAFYHPRRPTSSPLYHLLLNHFDRFEQVYDERFAKGYDFYRPVISEVMRAYLECADLKKELSTREVFRSLAMLACLVGIQPGCGVIGPNRN